MNKQLPEDIIKKIEQEADEYVKRQGSHDKPDITKHDFKQGYLAALSSFPLEKQIVELLGVCGKLNVLDCIEYVKQLQANQKQ